jgi:ABC-2 type transport system ATP-binding protein
MHELLDPEQTRVEIETRSATEMERQLRQTKWRDKIVSTNEHIVIMQLKKEEIPLLIQQMGELRLEVYSIQKRNSLEDYFLSLIAR